MIQEFFGWAKVIGDLPGSRHVDRWKIRQQVELTAAACNLARMSRLLAT